MTSLFLAFLITGAAIAQEIEVSGTVSTTDGETLPGVSVVLDGTQTGTTTDLDGNYVIDVPSDGTLVFTYIGYEPARENINGRSTIDVVLEPTVANLNELIVTGYSSQRRGDVTGAVASVDIESVERETSASVLQRLDGRVPGVTVQTSGSPGARNTVRIRGISSFQNNDPLYIIDGTPVQDSYANWLNPSDIESIQVLKDASAASIYGSRANNGVIIIETKKGTGRAPQVSLNIRTGIAQPVQGYDDFVITDALQYHEVLKRSYEYAGQAVPQNIYGDPNNPSIPNYIWPNDGENQTNNLQAQFGITEEDYAYENSNNLIQPGSAGTNWWDAVFGNALQQNYNLSVSGGSDSHTYNISFNYMDQEGTAAHNHFKRGTVRVNTEFDLGILTVGENVSLSLDETVGGITGNPGGFAEGGIIGKNILMQPVVPVYDIGGNFAAGKAVTLGNQGNPLKAAYTSKDDPNKTTRMFGNVFARFDVQEKVLMTSRFGFNLSQFHNRNFTAIFPEVSEPSLTNGISEFRSETTDWTWTNTLQYIDTFSGQHNVNLLLGHESNETLYRDLSGSVSSLLNTDVDSRFIQASLADIATDGVSSTGYRASLLSFFGKLAYNFDQRYFLDVTVRRDGSSRLGSNPP